MGSRPRAFMGYGFVLDTDDCCQLLNAKTDSCPEEVFDTEEVIELALKDKVPFPVQVEMQASYDSEDVFLIFKKDTHKWVDWDDNSADINDIIDNASELVTDKTPEQMKGIVFELDSFYNTLKNDEEFDAEKIQGTIGWHLATFYG